MNLIYPMFSMVLYIVLLGVYTFIVRRNSVIKRETHFKYFKTYDMSLGGPPEYVTRVGRHFDNQFQVPILFLITMLMYISLGNSMGTSLILQTTRSSNTNFYPGLLAWAFVISRMIHSYVHLGSNNVVYRFLSYASGLFIVLFLWILLLFK
jgi:hypothetical protein